MSWSHLFDWRTDVAADGKLILAAIRKEYGNDRFTHGWPESYKMDWNDESLFFNKPWNQQGDDLISCCFSLSSLIPFASSPLVSFSLDSLDSFLLLWFFLFLWFRLPPNHIQAHNPAGCQTLDLLNSTHFHFPTWNFHVNPNNWAFPT